MSEWDKSIIANAFAVPADQNTECTILVVTDAYGMDIDNQARHQWDIPLLFDLMIQRMGRDGKKGGASTFVLFTPKWTRLKDPDKIEKRNAGSLSPTAVNAQLLLQSTPSSQTVIGLRTCLKSVL